MNPYISFFAAAVVAATPLLFATIGEIFNEKAGNLNLGVEGMMLMGAVIGFQAALLSESAVIALLAAMFAGAMGAFIYAFLTVTLRANQTVTGLSLTIFGTGFSSFLGAKLVGQIVPASVKTFFKPYAIPGLSQIPWLGDIFFKQDTFVYLGYLTAIVCTLYLYKTRMGLSLIAVGENPGAADAAGISVIKYKYAHILAGGALCGLGGAYLSLVYVPAWQDQVTAGRGWIAVALVIFAGWNPLKALFGAMFFGGLDIIGFRIQGSGIAISQYLLDMLPYIVTILVLVINSMRKGRGTKPPKSMGTPYFREER